MTSRTLIRRQRQDIIAFAAASSAADGLADEKAEGDDGDDSFDVQPELTTLKRMTSVSTLLRRGFGGGQGGRNKSLAEFGLGVALTAQSQDEPIAIANDPDDSDDESAAKSGA